MKKLLAIIALSVATVGLTACETNGYIGGGIPNVGSSVSTPTTLSEFLTWLDQDNSNYVLETNVFGAMMEMYDVYTTYTFDYTKTKIENFGIETYAETVTEGFMVYTLSGDTWTKALDDGSFAMSLMFVAMIDSGGLKASDFTDGDDGTYTTEINDEGEKYTLTISVNEDGSFDFEMEGIVYSYSSFGTAAVTLPTVA